MRNVKNSVISISIMNGFASEKFTRGLKESLIIYWHVDMMFHSKRGIAKKMVVTKRGLT